MRFDTVFEIGPEHVIWQSYPALFFLIFIAFGVVTLRSSQASEHSRRVAKLFVIVWPLVILLIFGLSLKTYLGLEALKAHGDFKSVEGAIKNYRDYHYRPKWGESFEVQDIQFHYNPAIETGGFNQTRYMGGPIKPGEYVRIDYIPTQWAGAEMDNLIVKIQVRR